MNPASVGTARQRGGVGELRHRRGYGHDDTQGGGIRRSRTRACPRRASVSSCFIPLRGRPSRSRKMSPRRSPPRWQRWRQPRARRAIPSRAWASARRCTACCLWLRTIPRSAAPYLDGCARECAGRGALELAEGKAIYQRTGTPVHPMSPLVKLIWLRPSMQTSSRRRHGSSRSKSGFGSVVRRVVRGCFNCQRHRPLQPKHRWMGPRASRMAGITANQLSQLVPTTYTA